MAFYGDSEVGNFSEHFKEFQVDLRGMSQRMISCPVSNFTGNLP